MRQDREFYRDLAARYLEADTTAEEEKALAEYLARYAGSAEDKALARLLMLEHHGYLKVSGPCADMEEDACVPLSDEDGFRQAASRVPARNEETRMEEDTVVCIPAGLRRHRPCCRPAPHRVWQ